MSRLLLKVLAVFLLLVVFYFSMLFLTVFVFLQSIGNRYQIDIHGKWYPIHIVPGHFKMKEPSIRWKNHFTVFSGELEIHFQWFPPLLSNNQILLRGKNLKVELGEKYLQSTSERQVEIEQIEASFELTKGGEPVIHALEIKSPTLQFQLRNQ